MNPFDELSAVQLGGLGGVDGIGSRLKKSLQRATKKLVKVKDKIDAIHDSAPIIGKFVGKLRTKIEDSPAGRKVLGAVAGYFGGPVAAMGAEMVLTEQSKQRAEAKAIQDAQAADAAFLESEEGKLFQENQRKFDAAIAEMKSSPDYKSVYDKMKADGYTDVQIAQAWLTSKPVKEVATAATADTIYPIAYRQAVSAGIPEPQLVAAGASLQAAENAVNQQKGSSNVWPLVLTGISLLAFGG